MFCHKCGQELATDAAACAQCGHPVSQVGTAAAGVADLRRHLGAEAKLALAGVLETLKTLAVRPLSGVQESFAKLPKPAYVGLAFALLFNLLFVVALYRALRGASRWMPFLDHGSGVGLLLKLLMLGFVPFVATVGAILVTRKLFRGTGSATGDVFVAGVSLFPAGPWALLSGFLGAGNLEVVIALSVFTGCLTVLLLYSGCHAVCGIPERGSALAVPVILLISGWFTKVILVALL